MKKIIVAVLIACCCFGCSKKASESKIISCSISENQSVMSKSVLVDIQYNSSSPEVLERTETIRLTTSILQDSYEKAYALLSKKLNAISGVEFTYSFEGSTVESVTKIDLTKFDLSKISEIEFMGEEMLDNNKLTTENLRNYFILEEYNCSEYAE